jgi:CUB domain
MYICNIINVAFIACQVGLFVHLHRMRLRLHKLYDVYDEKANLIASLCGKRSNFHDIIISESNMLMVEFSSDPCITSIGFQATFELVTHGCTEKSCIGGSLADTSIGCEMSSVAYDATNDLAYLSFGRGLRNTKGLYVMHRDVSIYNFATGNWTQLALGNNSPSERVAPLKLESAIYRGLMTQTTSTFLVG